MGKLAIPILDADLVTQSHLIWFEKLKVLLTRKDPKIFGYLKIRIDFVLQEQRIKPKGKWYLDSACSNHMTGNKYLFKSIADHNGEKNLIWRQFYWNCDWYWHHLL